MEQIILKQEHIDERCRVCLECRESTIYLLDTISVKEKTLSYSDILYFICKIEMHNSNVVPHKICVACAEQAEAFYEFKLLCEHSEKILQSELASNTLDIICENGAEFKTENNPDLEEEKKPTQTNSDDRDLTNPITEKSKESVDILITTKNAEDNSTDNTSDDIKKGDIPEKYLRHDTKKYTEKCYFCDYTNSNGIKLGRHMTLSHNDKKNIQCTTCDMRFFKRKHMLDHVRRKHKENVTICNIANIINGNSDGPDNSNSCEERNGAFKCDFCDYSNPNRLNLEKHVTLFHDGKSNVECGELLESKHKNIFSCRDKKNVDTLKCDFCDYTNTSGFKLGKHMTLSHNDKKSIKCTKCDKRFFLKRHMQEHRRRLHELNVPYICEVCGKAFKLKGNLTQHMYIHNGTTKYVCPKCDRRFNSYPSLYRHSISHIEERNFKCEECALLFKTLINLNRHVNRIHKKGVSPVECTICSKSYANGSTLKRHMEAVHGGVRNHKCEECGKLFTTRHNLSVHQTVHTGERRHVCEFCGKGFSQAHVLRTHLKMHK